VRVAEQVDHTLLRVSAKYADQVRDAVRASVNVEQVVNDFLLTFPAGSLVTRRQAREWARLHVRTNPHQLALVLDQLHSVGYVLGVDYSNAAYNHVVRGIGKAVEANNATFALGFDWSTWTPGNRAAEALVRPPGGLARLLDRSGRGVVIKDMTDTTLDRIGTRLADGLAVGAADTAIAQSLRDVVGDPQRALTIAQTEMNRATSVATVDNYNELGVEQVEWFALDGCETCEGNAEAGPIAMGEDFPSGDTEPPAHPNCRCALLPFIEGDSVAVRDGGDVSDMGDNGSMDSIEMAVTPDRVKGVPGPLEVARALSRLEILPNPDHPELDQPEKFVESPWTVVPAPTINPNAWDDAVTAVVDLEDLYGTDPWLKRKNVRKHIEAMGQAVTPYRSYALIAEVEGKLIIVDGHHRLMATWLLGQDTAAVYKIVIK
jgi:SPP1 gp7 family putative phage head morphogenesis protein